uniref:Uncharacterized protein MANES_08G100300 n=1 Tax=Rhizophora mucronata TaxID=61149 RepID=A0A2P2JLH8_RHIMU
MGGDATEEGYKPEAGFELDSRESLVDLSSTAASTELWLIQWPYHEVPDFHGKEMPLNLHNDNGCLGTFEGSSSGKAYSVVSCTSEEPEATVFLSSSSETKIAGKISRRVSLVHYPEPEELEKLEAEKKSKRLYQMSARSSLISSSHHSVTPIQSTKLGNSHSSRGHSALTHSSRHNDSSLFDVDEQSNPRKRRRDHKPNFSEDGSTLDSGRGYSRYTFSGTSEHTQQWKLKVEVKGEE